MVDPVEEFAHAGVIADDVTLVDWFVVGNSVTDEMGSLDAVFDVGSNKAGRLEWGWFVNAAASAGTHIDVR